MTGTAQAPPSIAQESNQASTDIENEFDYALEGNVREAPFANVAYAPDDAPQHLVSDITSLPLQAVRESEEGEVDEGSDQSHASGSQYLAEGSSQVSATAQQQQRAPVSALGAIVAGALQHENAREASPRSANDALAAAAQNQAEIGSNSTTAEPAPIEQVISSNNPPYQQLPTPSTASIGSYPSYSGCLLPALPPRSVSPVSHGVTVSPRNPSSARPPVVLPPSSLGNMSELSTVEDVRTAHAYLYGLNPLGPPSTGPGPQIPSTSGAVGDSMGTFGDSSVFHQAYNVEFAGEKSPIFLSIFEPVLLCCFAFL